MENFEDSRGYSENNQALQQMINILFDLNNINQKPHRCKTAEMLVLIPMESVTKSSLLTSSFQENSCGGWKQEIHHHYENRYLYLTDMMVNVSCHK